MQLIERFNKLGICSSQSTKIRILDQIGGHFADILAVSVKNGKTLRGTGDNWDMLVMLSHIRKGMSNKSLHLFASNIIVNRLSFSHLDNLSPKDDILTLPRERFIPDIHETKILRENFKILVGRICVEFLTKFKFLKSIVNPNIKHKYSEEMTQKSTIISLPILNCNENNYNDCVTILRTYEKWIFEIHQKAGLINEYPYMLENPDLPARPVSNPGQPGAHIPSTVNDPMYEMKIPFAGDQLTRVRFAGAKDLLAGAHTPGDRFEHCSPFKPVMFHTKASFLQYCYALLYHAESVDQVGTLKYFREKLNRKNVTPQKVLDSFDGCEELVVSTGKAYIVVALMNFFGMESLDEFPKNNVFVCNIIHKPYEVKKEYFDKVIGKFVDSYIFQRGQSPPCGVDEDYVKNYALCLSYLSLVLMQLIDTAREGDGDRNLINQKVLLTIFRSLNSYSKYAIEMFTSIAQIECLLTPRMSEEFRWGFFCNWNGGKARNIEDDMAQEIYNNISKNAVKHLGSNKSLQTIDKICRATSGIKEIRDNFDTTMQIHKSSTRHTQRTSYDDEIEIIKDLLVLKPFHFISGRVHASFPDIKRAPSRYMTLVEHNNWLDDHIKKMSGQLY